MKLSNAKFLIVLLAVPAGCAFAGDDEVSVCPSLQELDNQLISCGDNYFAAELAKECSDKIVTSWKTAAALLQPQLLASGRNQSVSEAETKASYEKAAATLKTQIIYMQEGTALIASYPDVMIDFPDSKGEEASLSCFNEAFADVQDIVKGLDKEIVAAKKVYELAKKLRDTAGTRQSGLDKSLISGLSEAGKMAKGSSGGAVARRGKSPRAPSDITGVKEDQQKRSADSLDEVFSGKLGSGVLAP